MNATSRSHTDAAPNKSEANRPQLLRLRTKSRCYCCGFVNLLGRETRRSKLDGGPMALFNNLSHSTRAPNQVKSIFWPEHHSRDSIKLMNKIMRIAALPLQPSGDNEYFMR